MLNSWNQTLIRLSDEGGFRGQLMTFCGRLQGHKPGDYIIEETSFKDDSFVVNATPKGGGPLIKFTFPRITTRQVSYHVETLTLFNSEGGIEVIFNCDTLS